MAVTPDDLKEFIGVKWRDAACPRCTVANWSLGESDEMKGVLPVNEDQSGFNLGPRHIPMYWIVCNNCGHLEFIATKVVRAWQESKADGGGYCRKASYAPRAKGHD